MEQQLNQIYNPWDVYNYRNILILNVKNTKLTIMSGILVVVLKFSLCQIIEIKLFIKMGIKYYPMSQGKLKSIIA